jgi:hypothetical protein
MNPTSEIIPPHYADCHLSASFLSSKLSKKNKNENALLCSTNQFLQEIVKGCFISEDIFTLFLISKNVQNHYPQLFYITNILDSSCIGAC